MQHNQGWREANTSRFKYPVMGATLAGFVGLTILMTLGEPAAIALSWALEHLGQGIVLGLEALNTLFRGSFPVVH